MSCLGDFVISLYMFKLYEKHFIINHCLTLELCKYLKKKDIPLECCFAGRGTVWQWGCSQSPFGKDLVSGEGVGVIPYFFLIKLSLFYGSPVNQKPS